MRIPLDYYRILGLPIQATADQLQQAYRDRTLQLPRREFSEMAIATRKSLLDQAYAELSDPAQRQAYDARFLAKSSELLEVGRGRDFALDDTDPNMDNSPLEFDVFDATEDPYTPDIEIDDSLLVGALLILWEMGEYELVLRLSHSYLSETATQFGSSLGGGPNIIHEDIVLTAALACLELGREQWQQGQYENAAESLETGEQLLLRERLFANIRGEMQSDLFKLRPYRILELVALPEDHDAERRHGLSLLEGMLKERGGIDGAGDDQSGLSTDDFLRFIQQLRAYMTAAEQHAMFELEARRPSAVAIYLAVYALLARGFAQRQPALIRRAKQMLARLGSRQDVHLEQAICALLLGQTEEANYALELSQEFESLAFIREHSQGSPDQLPGLCLYSERWLQNEVFPHFRDLMDKRASLKEYFADEQVQAYLEELPSETETSSTWVTAQKADHQTVSNHYPIGREPQLQKFDQPDTPVPPIGSSRTVVLDAPEARFMPAVEPTPASGGRWERSHSAAADSEWPGEESSFVDPADITEPASPVAAAATRAVLNEGTSVRRPRRGKFRLDRLLFLAALGMLSVLGLTFLTNWLTTRGPSTIPVTSRSPSSSPTAGATSPSPAAATVASTTSPAATTTASNQVQPLQSPLNQVAQQQQQALAAGTTSSTSSSPSPTANPTTANTAASAGPLTTDGAKGVVQSWLSAKSAAMGQSYATDQLPQILTGSALTQWQGAANAVKTDNVYLTYEHSDLTIERVTPNPDDPNRVTVDATVTEKQESFTNGRADGNDRESPNLQVTYELVRQNGRWLIESIAAQ